MTSNDLVSLKSIAFNYSDGTEFLENQIRFLNKARRNTDKAMKYLTELKLKKSIWSQAMIPRVMKNFFELARSAKENGVNLAQAKFLRVTQVKQSHQKGNILYNISFNIKYNKKEYDIKIIAIKLSSGFKIGKHALYWLGTN